MKTISRTLYGTFLVIAQTLLSAPLAFALPADTLPPSYSGYISGTLALFRDQGGYCPTYRNEYDCTGARYLNTEAYQTVPVKNAKVYLRTGSTVIGQGVSDSQGRFNIRWLHSSPLTSADLIWTGENSTNNFRVATPSGGYYNFRIPNIAVTSGTSTNIGTRTWGNELAPNYLANLYDVALRTWDSLAFSSLLVSRFTGVELRAFDSNACADATGGNAGACAGPKRVYLVDTDTVSDGFTVAHEMGHVADFLAGNGYSSTSSYDYPATSDRMTGHSLDSAEWGAVQMTEGFADFVANRTYYWQTAKQPLVCKSSTFCPTNATDLEANDCPSTGASPSRRESNAARYFRDLYDSSEDYYGERLSYAFGTFFDTIDAFPSGYGNGARDEPWRESCAWYWLGLYCTTSIDDRDGRSVQDFRRHFETRYGISTSSQYTAACDPVGD